MLSTLCRWQPFDPVTLGSLSHSPTRANLPLHYALLCSTYPNHKDDFESCFAALLSSSRVVKRSDLLSIACPLAYLFKYVSFSTILHHSLPLLFFFFSKHYPWGMGEEERRKKKRKLGYSTGDCGNPLIKACILIHPKACLTVYYELLCDH